MKYIETHEQLDRLIELESKYQYNIPNGSKTSEDGHITYKYVQLELAKTMGIEMAELKVSKVEVEVLKEARAKAMLEGLVYNLNGIDYQVPFMKDDADGLMQVDKAFQLGITETVIHFSNGTKMPIKASEFQDFAIWFVTKRNSFFVGGN